MSIRDLGGLSLTDGCFIGALRFCSSYVSVAVLIFILVAMDMCLFLLPYK